MGMCAHEHDMNTEHFLTDAEAVVRLSGLPVLRVVL